MSMQISFPNIKGCCGKLGQTVTNAGSGALKYAKIVGTALTGVPAKIASFVRNFFAFIGPKMGPIVASMKGHVVNGFAKSGEYLKGHPKLAAVAGVGIACGMAVAALFTRSYRTTAAPNQNPPTVSAT
jgi:hypothetical protein